MGDHAGGPTAGGGIAHRHEQSRQFAAYMLALPRQDFRPLRSAFDPAKIPNLLPRIVLLDLTPDGTYRYRLAGTELENYFGHDLTGKTLAAGVGERAAGQLQMTFDRMMAQPCGLLCIMDITDSSARVALFETVVFPLAGVSPPQQIAHIAILERTAYLAVASATSSGKSYEMQAIDLGAGMADFSDISW
ncbi:MAG: PAS domain-containing protein [Proteobacteria bacterium]|nr:PAS domain-containing protein [Pseudomonadota bacterium]